MKEIFCDEAGFTGNNLLDSNQPFFAFSSISLTTEEAENIVLNFKNKNRINSEELHANQMLRRVSRHEALLELLEEIASRSKIIYCDKRYSLSCKMFEYLIEPIISKNSIPLYNIGFHKFITNILYYLSKANNQNNECYFIQFQEYIRSCDWAIFDSIIKSISKTSENDCLESIAVLLKTNKNALQSELNLLKGNDEISKWILDLSDTSLYSLNQAFIEEGLLSAKIVCDESKPLIAMSRIFQHPQKKISDSPLSLSFFGDLVFRSSSKTSGLQLADILASSFVYSLKNTEIEFSKKCLKILNPQVHPNSIVPNIEWINFKNDRMLLNLLILNEITKLSTQSIDFLVNLEKLIIELRGEIPSLKAKLNL